MFEKEQSDVGNTSKKYPEYNKCGVIVGEGLHQKKKGIRLNQVKSDGTHRLEMYISEYVTILKTMPQKLRNIWFPLIFWGCKCIFIFVSHVLILQDAVA